jgi:hypothetical protein
MLRIGCQGFTEPNLFTLLNKNQTAFLRKEYLICGAKIGMIFENAKKHPHSLRRSQSRN